LTVPRSTTSSRLASHRFPWRCALFGALAAGEEFVAGELGKVGMSGCDPVDAFDSMPVIFEGAFDWAGDQMAWSVPLSGN
jgi:hypothetical protein